MARLLPSTSDAEAPDAEPRVVGLDSDDADELLSALSSGTARRLLSALHEKPDTPSGVADRIETSLQNAQYHLGKLEDADLVEVADTVYSEKGREMRVYAPSDAPLVVFAGRDDERTGLKAALLRLLGGVGVLGLASVAVQRLLSPPGAMSGADSNGDSGAAPVAGGDGDAAEGDGNGVGGDGADDDGGAGGGDDAGGNGAAEEDADEPAADADDESGATGEETEGDGGFEIQEEPAKTESPAETATESGTVSPTETAEAATETASPEPTVTEAAASAADSTVDAAMALEPGVVFFLGGALVLSLAFAVWYYGYRTR